VSNGDSGNLEHIDLLADLPPEARLGVERRCRWRHYARGEHVLERDNENRDVFFVVSGAVRIVNHSLSGREIAYANVRPGGYFGELSAIDGLPRSATVVATEDCLLASISSGVFLELLEGNPGVGLKVLQRLTQVIRTCDDRIMDLSTLRAFKRVYVELLRLARPDPTAADAWLVRPMPTQTEIAGRAGTARETVARVLGDLAHDGIVERKGRTLHLLYKQELERLVSAVDPDSDDEAAR